MKVNSERQLHIKNNANINFGSGWNAKIASKIQHCNINEISEKLSKKNIETDFQKNKTVAWCCEKVVDIFEQLNKKYKIKLDLPKAIFIEDFSKIDITDNKMISFCNWFPSQILKDNPKTFSEQTLFFNSNFPWENIDAITENRHKSCFWSNSHFLTNYVHEFGHSAHNGYLLGKFNLEELHSKLMTITSENYSQEYQEKFKRILSTISTRASDNPLETLAEDMSNKVVSVLDISNLDILKNPFAESLYPKSDLNSFFKTKTEKESLLKKAWNINL